MILTIRLRKLRAKIRSLLNNSNKIIKIYKITCSKTIFVKLAQILIKKNDLVFVHQLILSWTLECIA